MLKLKCVDASNLAVLKEGEVYYGFPVNSSSVYISRFPREGSHMGCYQLNRFVEIATAEVPEQPKKEPEINVESAELEQLTLF